MTTETQFLAPALTPEDDEVERSLRPRRLDDFVGQERVKEQLRSRSTRRSRAARRSTTCCSSGRPGSGKTSLAFIIREELGVGIRTIAGPALERKGDMAAILTALESRDVLFVDEIHRLNRAVEEILYPALEDFRLDIVVGQGPAARTLTLDLPPFTLVGATTRTGLLTTPLRDRFGMTFRLGYYEPDELARSCAARRASSASRSATRRRTRSRGAPAARRGSRTASCAASATSPRCATQASDHRGHRRRGARAARGRRAGARAHRPRAAAGDRRQVRAAAPSGCRRSPSRSARSPTRSRTSTSRTCSSSASSSGRRAGASSPRSGGRTSARRRRRGAACSRADP